jgi:hypothetical protein
MELAIRVTEDRLFPAIAALGDLMLGPSKTVRARRAMSRRPRASAKRKD